MTTHPPSILTIHALAAGRGSGTSDTLNASLHLGQHLVVSGPSGCGKTSLLQVLVGLRPAHGGTVTWQQQVVQESNLHWWRQQFCYLPQDPVMGAMSLIEALLLPWRLGACSHTLPVREQYQPLLHKLGLHHDDETAVTRLSGGEKQRLAIARAVLMNRPLWFMDEPTSALDPNNRNNVLALLAQESVTVVSVSHDPAWIACADQQYTMHGNDHKEP